MSMNPNDPFQNPNDNRGFEQGAPQKKSKKGCLIGCGIFGILGVLVCCGGGFFMMQFGLSMFGDVVKEQIADSPVIAEHIGEIESFQPSISATIQQAQEAEPGEEGSFAFEIEGSKGSGVVIIKQAPGGDGSDFESVILVMPDGTRHPIEVSSDESDDLDFEVEIDSAEPFDPIEIEN